MIFLTSKTASVRLKRRHQMNFGMGEKYCYSVAILPKINGKT